MSSAHDVIARLRAEPLAIKRPRVERMPKSGSGKNKAREMPFQVRLVVALRRRLPEGSLVWHTFNRRSSRTEAIFAKQMGALAGMPDLFVLAPAPVIFSEGAGKPLGPPRLLAIECKAKGGVLSEAQVEIGERLGRLGVPYFLARDIESALEWVARFVSLKERC